MIDLDLLEGFEVAEGVLPFDVLMPLVLQSTLEFLAPKTGTTYPKTGTTYLSR